MDINLPDVLAEVRAAFDRYEQALVTNDVEALDDLFFESDTTIRYGGGENLYGIGAIRAFRAARSPAGLMRQLERTEITTYGRDFAVAATLFRRDTAPGKVGRQMQSWMRTPGGWKVVAAHVSVIDEVSHVDE
ncbi:oxalurate catabolism protein HpxZ [Ancylobacter mangrovi]|uniref:oxalurate catabolism protein HpxZ n=1 Tax=Ancylobacter mangrovi TaxID=2972472 RepID=UPI0021622651|nr:oxalurate catabolism protein HpxZ [Ancylobacter mangrovi]MCS0503406.1 oxalurate catabolism protein HpxZ [Ancylobacter mangrovi]